MKRRKLKLEELNRISVAEFQEVEKMPLIVVLDNVRSQHNIGSVFRTGDAFRVEEICAASPRHRPTQRYTKRPLGLRTRSIGAILRIPWKPLKR